MYVTVYNIAQQKGTHRIMTTTESLSKEPRTQPETTLHWWANYYTKRRGRTSFLVQVQHYTPCAIWSTLLAI